MVCCACLSFELCFYISVYMIFRSIMTDLYHLSQADGAGDWREKEAKELSDLVQNRIMYLQVNYIHTPFLFSLFLSFVEKLYYIYDYIFSHLSLEILIQLSKLKSFDSYTPKTFVQICEPIRSVCLL